MMLSIRRSSSTVLRLAFSHNTVRQTRRPTIAVIPKNDVNQRRSFYEINNNNKSNNNPKANKPNPNKKKKKPVRGRGGGGTAGRIAMQEPSYKRKGKSKKPRLCTGCGTEVISGQTADGGSIFATGEDAVAKGGSGGSKRSAKLARYADLGDKHQQSSTFLCQRCEALKSDNIWGAYDAIRDVDPVVFTEQLGHIVRRRKFGLCIIVADATDPEHSAPKNVRRSIGKTPAILVLSKCDLLPRMNHRDIKTLSMKVSNLTGLRFIDTFAVSARTGSGILPFAEYLLQNLRGRDVFCVGSANVGKSTLVQKLAASITPAIYLKGKGRHVNKRKEQLADIPVTASHLPGTTLQAVRVPCFPSDRHALWDTPGIIQKKAVQYSLFAPHLMEPLARARPIPLARGWNVRPGYTVLVEAAWMDPPTTDDDETDDEDCDFDDEDEDEDDYDYDNTNKHAHEESQLPPVSETCVLARMDVVSVEGGRGVFVRPYLHPSLRTRIVPTRSDMVPTAATIPSRHVQSVQSRMRKAFNDDLVTSRPLAAYISPDNPEGHLWPTDKERDSNSGKIYMDVVFASLGWFNVVHDRDFRLKPWCVEGSVYSKRRALYPTFLSEHDAEDQRKVWEDEIEYMKSDEARRILDASAREGRSNSGRSREEVGMSIGGGGGTDGGDYSDYIYDVDDEWY